MAVAEIDNGVANLRYGVPGMRGKQGQEAPPI